MTMELALKLIPLLPLTAFLINGLVGKKLFGKAAHWVALAAVGGSFLLALKVLSAVIGGALKRGFTSMRIVALIR